MSNTVHVKTNHVINTVVLIVKQMLYRLKCLEQKQSIDQIMVELNTFYYIEKHNARIIG